MEQPSDGAHLPMPNTQLLSGEMKGRDEDRGVRTGLLVLPLLGGEGREKGRDVGGKGGRTDLLVFSKEGGVLMLALKADPGYSNRHVGEHLS